MFISTLGKDPHGPGDPGDVSGDHSDVYGTLIHEILSEDDEGETDPLSDTSDSTKVSCSSDVIADFSYACIVL